MRICFGREFANLSIFQPDSKTFLHQFMSNNEKYVQRFQPWEALTPEKAKTAPFAEELIGFLRHKSRSQNQTKKVK